MSIEPTDIPTTFPDPSAQEPKRPGSRLWVVLGAVVAALAVVLVTLVLSRHGGSDPSAGTTTAKGTLTLYTTNLTTTSAGCEGTGGYSDIEHGAQVQIADASGKVLALGKLGESTGFPGTCVFAFSVPGVPTSQAIYQVQVSHRGYISVKAADLQDISVTLGS